MCPRSHTEHKHESLLTVHSDCIMQIRDVHLEDGIQKAALWIQIYVLFRKLKL